MKVTCKVIQDLLPLYVDGVCSPDTAALVEEHLKDCASCQEAYHALKEAPVPTPGDGADKDAAVAKGLKKVKKSIRRKRLVIVSIVLVAAIAVSIPVGMWMSIPCMTLPVEEVTFDISEENGILSITTDAAYTATMGRVYYPDGTDAKPWDRKNGSALVYSASYTPLEGLLSHFDDPEADSGNRTEDYRADQWATTEDGWWKLNGQIANYLDDMDEMMEKYPDYPFSDIVPDSPRSPEEDESFLYQGIEAIYYYDGVNAGLWRKDNDELLADLEKHGTLLWTAEDGVVYDP